MGRERELQRFEDVARAGEPRAVVVAGPAGVGKTALATSAALRLAGADADVVRVTATRSAASIPLGAVAQLLPARGTGAVEQADLIRHTASALADRNRERGVIVVVDDAHLLDDASATLVHQLVVGRCAFLIITLRSGVEAPDPITALWKDGLAERLDIGTLGLADSSALAAAMLGGPLHPAAMTALHESSGGNPLFLQQLVAGGRDAGALVFVEGRGPVPGRWSLVRPLPLPADLVAAIEARLSHLTDSDRQIIELVALGEPLGAALLEELAGVGSEQQLERLEAEGFIVATAEGRRLEVRLAHPLYGEVLRAGAPRSWANRARRMLAAGVIAAGMDRVGDALRVATWLLDAGAPIPVDVASEAARQAIVLFDAPLAGRIVAGADEVVLAGDPELLLLVAQVAARCGDAPGCYRSLDQLDALLDGTPHDGRLRSKAIIERYDAMTYIEGRFEESFALTVPSDGDPDVGSELVAHQAVLASFVALPELAEHLLASCQPRPQEPSARAWMALARSLVAGSRGRTEEALASAAEGLAVLDEHGWDPTLPEAASFVHARTRHLVQAGRLDEARALVDDAMELERGVWSDQGIGWVRMSAAAVYRLQGLPLLAAEHARRAVEVFGRAGSPQLQGVALAELAMASAVAGDPAGAGLAAAKCDELGLTNFYGRMCIASAAVARGEVSTGIEMLVAMLERRFDRDTREELLLVLDIVRLGGAVRVTAQAAALVTRTDSALATVVARFATAVADGDGNVLDAVAEHFAQMGCHLPAAEAALAAGSAHARGGDGRRSRASAARGRELRGVLDGARTPGLLDATAQALLTPREREIAAVAAAGSTSRAIAAMFGLSHRTVESYLQRAYEKLGVASRQALAEALGGAVRPESVEPVVLSPGRR